MAGTPQVKRRRKLKPQADTTWNYGLRTRPREQQHSPHVIDVDTRGGLSVSCVDTTMRAGHEFGSEQATSSLAPPFSYRHEPTDRCCQPASSSAAAIKPAAGTRCNSHVPEQLPGFWFRRFFFGVASL